MKYLRNKIPPNSPLERGEEIPILVKEDVQLKSPFLKGEFKRLTSLEISFNCMNCGCKVAPRFRLQPRFASDGVTSAV